MSRSPASSARDRIRVLRTVLLGVVALAAAAFIGVRVEQPEAFVAFAILVAASGLFEVPLPNEVPYSLGLAPGLGFVLLGRYEVAEVVAMFVLGVAGSIAVRALVRKELRIEQMAAQTVAVSASAAAYSALARIDSLPSFDAQDTVVSGLGFAAMLAIVVMVHASLAAVHVVQQKQIPFVPVFVGQLRSTGALHLSTISVGALLALSYPTLRYWSFPLFLLPLSATQFAFRQFDSIRKTYLQTIRALSKVPEMAGYTRPGHSTRVAEMSVAIARELSLDERELDQIEYAALLHDIGRVSIPDPQLATEATGRTELAIVGAEIVRETGHFPSVADMIAHQYDSYRRPGEDVNPRIPIGSRIIKVASAYDDLTRPDGVGLSHWDAIEHLHDGMKYEYDPAVVGALIRVIEKRDASMPRVAALR